MFEEIKALTIHLVEIASVNGTPGERTIGTFIEQYLHEMPYFQDHPDQVYTIPLADDPLGRRSVVALLRGTKGGGCPDTIICHGHTDTVGVDDYGALEPLAFSCDALAEALKTVELPKDARADLDSGDWLFGRGACDMKSGDAVFLVLLRHLSQHPENLRGNLLFSFNPVEENLHTGIIETLPLLQRLRSELGLRYRFAINNDYTCPLYPGDPHRYIYTGAVGKLLPCFYIQGRETHVGQPFEGFDAATVMAELIRELNLNPDYCDAYAGEYTLPPSVLYSRDQKVFYNVQTAGSAYTYFNYAVHSATMEEIVQKLRTAAETALRATEEAANQRYLAYCDRTKTTYETLSHPFQVYTYQELFTLAAARAPETESLLAALTRERIALGEDKRLVPMHLARKLLHLAGITSPAVVLLFAAPYCPHTTLRREIPEERRLSEELTDMVTRFGESVGEDIRVLHFFPSLSDSSYLKMDDTPEALRLLLSNFPAWEQLYHLPFDAIASLQIPALNYGVYGKDAHKWTERLYMPYSFRTLPALILKTIETYLN